MILDEPQLFLNPPNVTVHQQVRKNINLSNTKEDYITDNETNTLGGQASFHLKSGAFHQTLNKKGFTSPNYHRVDTINRALNGKDGTFSDDSQKMTQNYEIQNTKHDQNQKNKETVLKHFSSSSKEGTKLQVVNKTKNKAYDIERIQPQNERVTTLPQSEYLPSSNTNEQVTHTSQLKFQEALKSQENQQLPPKSPDIERMTTTIANYLKECQQSESIEAKKGHQISSALIDNTQMRAKLSTARQNQSDVPINPNELFSFKKKLKPIKATENQGRMFSKLSARNKAYNTIDDKARKDRKSLSFNHHSQRNRANLLSVNNGEYGPFNNSALAESLRQQLNAPGSSRLTTSMLQNRNNNLTRAQQYSQRHETQFSQLSDMMRESPMLIKPFPPQRIQNGPTVQFFRGKIPDNNGFFKRRNLKFSMNGQNRPSTQVNLMTNNHTSKQMSTIDCDATSKISHGGSSSLTGHKKTRQINLKHEIRDSEQFVQDFMIEQNVIENAMQPMLSSQGQNILVEALESPSRSRDYDLNSGVKKKELQFQGQKSPQSNMTGAAAQRVQAVQNQILKVNEDRNSQTAPTGNQRVKKKSMKANQEEDDFAINQILKDGLEPISDSMDGQVVAGQSGDLSNHNETFQMKEEVVSNNEYINLSDQKQSEVQIQAKHSSKRQSNNEVIDDPNESQGEPIERETPLKMILKSTLNANQKSDAKVQAERAAAQLRKQKELARLKAERDKLFTKEDEKRIIGYIHRQYYRFCKRKEEFVTKNSIIGASNPTSQCSYNTDLANLQQLSNAAKYKSLYTFSFFKKYMIDKFLEQNSDFALQVAKKAMSALESLRTLKKQRSAHFTNIDHAAKTETLGSQDGLDPKAFEHHDIPLSELHSKYNKINAVTEACNRSQLGSGSPSRGDTAFLPNMRSREQSQVITKQDQNEPTDITMDEHQELLRQSTTGAAPSPKIKILHRPALFEQSLDMLNSDRGSRHSQKEREIGFIEASLKSPTSNKGIRIPESLSSSFAEYETYIAYIQLQESQIETQNTNRYKKTGVSVSRQKRGGEPGVDLTSLADRKLFTSMKPQLRIQTLDFNKQIQKIGQAARAETLLQNCQRHEKKKIQNLYEKIKSLDPDSKVLKEQTQRDQKSPLNKSFRQSRYGRMNATANSSIIHELRTSRVGASIRDEGYEGELLQTSTDLEVQATAMSLASKNHAELQRLIEQGYFDKDAKNHVITLVTPGANINNYNDTSQRIQRLQNPPSVHENYYHYDKNKLPSFGISMTNSGLDSRISPRHTAELGAIRPKKLSSIHINDMTQIHFQTKASSKFDPGTVRLQIGRQTQQNSVSSQISQNKQVRHEDTRTTDSNVMLKTGEQTRKISYNNIINDDYNNQEDLLQNQAYQTFNDPNNVATQNNQGPIFEQNEQLEHEKNSQSLLTQQSGAQSPTKTKRSVLMKSSVDSKGLDRSNNITNNAAQSYRYSEIPEKVQDDFLSKENQNLGSGNESLRQEYDPMFEYGLFDQINNTLNNNNHGVSNISSIRDIVPIQSVMSNPVKQKYKKTRLNQKNLIDGRENTEPEQSGQTISDKHILSEGNQTLMKDEKTAQPQVMTGGNNTVVAGQRRRKIGQPGSQDSQEDVVLDALGSCYGVMSPEIRRKSTQQRQNEKVLKNIRMKSKGNEDLNTIMPATKVKITRTGKPPTLSGSPKVNNFYNRQQKYDSFSKQVMDKEKNSSLNDSINSNYDSDPSVQQQSPTPQINSLNQREINNNSPDGVKVANLRISDDRSKQEYMNEVNNSIVQLQKLMQQQDLSYEDIQQDSPLFRANEQKIIELKKQLRKTQRGRPSNKVMLNGMFVSFDDQREYPNEFQKINQGFGDEASTLQNLKGCIQISKFTGSISPRKRNKNTSKFNSYRNSKNANSPSLLHRSEQQKENEHKIQVLQRMQRILIEHTEIENIMAKNKHNLTMRKNRY